MSFWGVLILLVITSIVLRILRSFFVWIDYIAYALIIIPPIIIWVQEGFWQALLALVLIGIAVTLLFGLGDSHEVRRGRLKWSLTCSKCGYGDLEILAEDESHVLTKCKRCGAMANHTLMRR